jgi:hypothetical protein
MGILTPSQLALVRYACQGWGAILNYNFQRLNDALLKVSAMQDVNLAGLADEHLLYYDAPTQTLRCAHSDVFFSTTTTSTSSTTTTTTTTA